MGPNSSAIEGALQALPAAQRSAIEAALEGPRPEAAPLATLTEALMALHRAEAHTAVLALTDAVPALATRSPATRVAHLVALEAVGRIEELRRALASTVIDPDHPAHRRILRMRMKHAAADGTGGLEALFGPMGPDLAAMLTTMPLDAFRSAHILAFADALYRLDPDRPMSLADYREAYLRGHAAEHLLQALSRMRAEDGPLRRLRHQLREMIVPFDPAPLIAAQRAGHGVLFARAHAGFGIFHPVRHPALSLPDAFVGRNQNPVRGQSGVNLATTSAAPRDFLRLVKAVRRAPHQITIYPDGQDGGERRAFALLGTRVSLGMGVATLAWHGRAATFFTGTRWQDGTITLTLEPGPVAPEMSRDAFEEAFHAFYLDRLAAIALGPPQDVVRQGGVWRAFISP